MKVEFEINDYESFMKAFNLAIIITGKHFFANSMCCDHDNAIDAYMLKNEIYSFDEQVEESLKMISILKDVYKQLDVNKGE